MLRESSCRQVPGEPSRRWISDDYFDLIIWGGSNDGFFGFQLCYGKPSNERALTWTLQSGFSHATVDDGESMPSENSTPMLTMGGHFSTETVRPQFLQRSAEIDPQIRDLVLGKIDEYARTVRAGNYHEH